MALHLKSTGIDYADFSGPTGSGNELMDDYEEGSWTGVITTGAGGASMDKTGCKYSKIGRIVHLTGAINTSSHSGGGACYITGLPFSTPASTGGTFDSRSAGSVSGWGFDGTLTNSLIGVIFASASVMYIQEQFQDDVGAHVDNDTEFRFQLTYLVSV